MGGREGGKWHERISDEKESPEHRWDCDSIGGLIAGEKMYVVAVTIWVKPQCVEAFIEATLENARNTRGEAGNIRFDVSQAEDEPGRFLLYEAYRAKDDFVKHQQTAH